MKLGYSVIKARVARVAPLAVLFVVVLAFAWLLPRLADDICYFLHFYRNNPLPAGTSPTWSSFFSTPDMWSNLCQITWTHYLGETGRFTTAFLLRLFAGMPNGVFEVANSLIWVWLCAMMWKLVGRAEKWRWLFVALFILFCVHTDAGIWFAGAINYLWPLTFTLATFLYIFRSKTVLQRLSIRTAWQLLLLPFGFILAGGHELISIVACLLLAVYWLIRIKEKNFRIDGQFLLTFGYGLGALALVFAPASLQRAARDSILTADVQMLYIIVKKGYDFVRYVCLNPLQVVPVLGVSIGFIFRRSVRERLDSVSRWLLLASLITLFSTLVLSNGLERTGWCATTMAFLACARILPSFFPQKFLHGFAWVCYALCAVTVFATTYGLYRQRDSLHRAVAEWRASSGNAIRMPYKCGNSNLGFVVRETWNPPITYGTGSPWTNPIVAKFYGKEACIAVEDFLYDNLYLVDKVCLPSNKVENCPGWYFVSEQRGLVFPLPAESAYEEGAELMGEYEYAVPVSFGSMFSYAKHLLKSGRAFAFSLKGEIPRKESFPGFVLSTQHGKYIVLDADPQALRDSIKNITFKPL